MEKSLPFTTTTTPGAHIVVALSGGVDSAVSAWLLKSQGYRVSALFAKCWDTSWETHPPKQGSTTCMSYEQDYQDVAHTCSILDIPFYTVDLSEEYRKQVFEDLLCGMKQGRTPNPDILCNRYIKFHHLSDYAFSLGADYFATGHYCITDGKALYKGKDLSKDQSYFLYAISPHILPRLLFPLGSLQKNQVRSLAQEAGLAVHNKKDSTGLCFVGKRSFQDFLASFLGEKPGPFCHLDGQQVGEHRGSHLYTLGQRRHLGLGGAGERWFVVGKDMERNIVYVTRGDHPRLYTEVMGLKDLRWWQEPPAVGDECWVKVRYGAAEVQATLESATQTPLQLRFHKPQRALTPGQSAVFYSKNKCLGGGVFS